MTFNTWIVLLVYSMISMRTGFALVLNSYSLQIDTSINMSSINSTNLIEKYKLSNKMMCLVQCNLIENCLSAA